MEKCYWIWLQEALGCASAAADPIVQQKLDPKQLFEADEETLLQYDFLTPALVHKMKNTTLSVAETILEKCRKKKIWLLTPDDDAYPQRLKELYQVPLVLYGTGKQELLNQSCLLTMVGSRRHSENGGRIAHDLAAELTHYGFGIVSGLAVGIDSCCHSGALDAGGVTIGVAGCGLNVQYPKENVELRRRVARNGVIITEYPPDSQPLPGHFPVRNRILSGLSLGTVVVEARANSGALRTVDHALEQGKDVFVLPVDWYNTQGKGNLRLLEQGATLALSPESIVEEYSALCGDILKEREQETQGTVSPAPLMKKEKNPAPLPSQEGSLSSAAPPAPALSEEKKQLLSCLTGKTLRVEELAQLCGIEMQETLVYLSELEIDGLVKAYPGKQFGR